MEKVPVTVKFESRFLSILDKMAHERFETRSELIRDITRTSIQTALEQRKLKEISIDKWMNNEITTTEFKDIIGRTEAEEVILFRKTMKNSIIEGLKIGKEWK